MDFKQAHVVVDHNHGRPLTSCRFHPDGKSVYYGAEDFSVWRWEVGSETKIEYPTQAWVRAIALVEDGKALVTGGYDGRLSWGPAVAEEPKPSRTIDAHIGWIRAMAVSPDGAVVATVGNDLVVRLWSIADGSLKAEFKGDPAGQEGGTRHERYIYNVAFHPDGKSLATGDLMGKVIHWDLASGKPTRAWTAESFSKYDTTFRADIGGFRSLEFHRDGTKLFGAGITKVTNAFAGVGEPTVVEFDWNQGKQTAEYHSKPKLQGVAWRAVHHPYGTIIAAHGGSGGTLVFWSPPSVESGHQVKLSSNGRDLDLAADGLHLAVACANGHLQVFLLDAKQPAQKS